MKTNMKRVISATMVVFMLGTLGGCRGFTGLASNSDVSTVYDYEGLTESQKQVVDEIYSYYDEWSYHIMDSSEEWPVTNVGFYTNDGNYNLLYTGHIRKKKNGLKNMSVRSCNDFVHSYFA